jgi:hypothetical protein
MSIDEARRLLLHDAARNAWGAEAALVLMEMLPPTGWADVATCQELAHLEARIGHRLDRLEARVDHQIEALRLEFRADLAIGQRRAIQWNVATIIAVVAAATAIARLG